MTPMKAAAQSEMVEIPADIMQVANECVAEFRWNNDNRWHLFVARALMAERERARSQAFEEAAQKARQWSEHYPQSSDGRNTFILFAEWAEEQAEVDRSASPPTQRPVRREESR